MMFKPDQIKSAIRTQLSHTYPADFISRMCQFDHPEIINDGFWNLIDIVCVNGIIPSVTTHFDFVRLIWDGLDESGNLAQVYADLLPESKMVVKELRDKLFSDPEIVLVDQPSERLYFWQNKISSLRAPKEGWLDFGYKNRPNSKTYFALYWLVTMTESGLLDWAKEELDKSDFSQYDDMTVQIVEMEIGPMPNITREMKLRGLESQRH